MPAEETRSIPREEGPMAARIPIDAVRSLLAVLGVVSIHAPADAQGIGGDRSRGERVFQRRYARHSVDAAESGLEGTNRTGVVGGKGDESTSRAKQRGGGTDGCGTGES